MDISLVSIKKNRNDSYDISWAGANNPFWFIVNGEFYEVKADKQPIGKTDNPTLFATHYFKFNKGDCFFMFTDGYADQFGGPKGKKLKYKAFKETLLNNYRLPVTEQKNELKISFDNWKGSLEQVDDVLVIGVNF
jgi:serine phosphatase RsbU (regulator of sigma subunit)